jgi:hypothetical protein
MTPPPKAADLVGRYARSLGILLLLLAMLRWSLPMSAPSSQYVSPAASGIEGGAPGEYLGLRLPGRLSYQVEHSICRSRVLGFDNGASGDDASANPRLPGRVYYRLLFHSATCP